MAASTVSMAASSSLCNKLYNLQAITQIPTNHLPSLFKTKSPKPLKLEKAQNPSALHLSLLSLSHFRQFSASFDGFRVTEDSQDEPETEQEEEEEEEAVEEEEEPKVAASDEAARLYVGNLPYSMTSSSLAEVFAEAGTVASAEIVYDRVTDRSRGFGFVTMGSVEEAKEAIRLFDGSQIGGRTVKVNFPEVPRGGERAAMGPKLQNSYQGFVDSPHKIYAGNLGWGLTSQGLRDAFQGQPGLLSAKVIFERYTGRSRGFGFVTFETAEDLQSALDAMNGVEVEGRPLRLNMANERAPPVLPAAKETKTENSIDGSELLSSIST
ncbi:hypothetical protein CUMW_004630 [Citrus unshiu]|nr:hypothetical protein CUMW_004630 [Citrus unshiu]GAY32894.1 hypothetical protein CUMW_004630 [Citrus unshiu]